MDILIPISSIWSFLRWMPKFILRKKFSPDRLAKLVYFDLRPRHESSFINFGASPEFRLWVQIINLSPFEIELDRSELYFWCGPKLRASTNLRKIIASGQIVSFCLEESLNEGQADHAALNVSNGSCRLDGYIQFNCALHSFTKAVTLDGINPVCINANLRNKETQVI